MDTKTNFGDWLKAVLKERGMKAADLARRTGMQSGVVSNLIRNKRHQPSANSCKLIADALNLPLEAVYRAAGILPEAADVDPVTEHILHILKNLSPEDRQEVLDYAHFKSIRKLGNSEAVTIRNGDVEVTTTADMLEDPNSLVNWFIRQQGGLE